MTGAVVLAAGASLRYGYPNKLLALHNGAPVLVHTLGALAASPLRPIVVVTGRHHAAISALARGTVKPAARLRVVRNRHYRAGQAHSLRAGIQALPRACDAALLCLGDMPDIDRALVDRVLRAAGPGVDTVRPVHAGRPGHPVWVSRALFAPLRASGGDAGARGVLAALPAARTRIIAGPPGCSADIDTPRALRARAARCAQSRRSSKNKAKQAPT